MFFFQKYTMKLCEPSPAAIVTGRGQHTITSLTISPTSSHVILTTHTGQIFTNTLPSVDDEKVK